MDKEVWFAVVNPASANGRTGKEWNRVHRILTEHDFKIDYALTTRPGEATELTRRALGNYNRIMAVGGDGTLNEVVNGFFEGQTLINPEASLSIFSHGTGGDFLRSLKLKRGVADLVEVLNRRQVISLDCGRVDFQDSFGNSQQRYFLNVADIGLGGETVARVNHHSKFLGGKLSFLLGSLVSILLYRNKEMQCWIDGELVVNGPTNSIMVANGRYIGGGMMIAPNADFRDGSFDVVVLGDFSTLELLYHLPKIYRGKHLQVSGVAVYKGKDIVVHTQPSGLLDVDGEQPGSAPAHFSLIPQAIPLWT